MSSKVMRILLELEIKIYIKAFFCVQYLFRTQVIMALYNILPLVCLGSFFPFAKTSQSQFCYLFIQARQVNSPLPFPISLALIMPHEFSRPSFLILCSRNFSSLFLILILRILSVAIFS